MREAAAVGHRTISSFGLVALAQTVDRVLTPDGDAHAHDKGRRMSTERRMWGGALCSYARRYRPSQASKNLPELKTGTTTQRGYGPKHQRARAREAKRVARGEAFCTAPRCEHPRGRWIAPGETTGFVELAGRDFVRVQLVG